MSLCQEYFIGGGQTQTSFLWKRMRALAGRIRTSSALLVGIFEIYVDCAAESSMLEHKLPNQLPHPQIRPLILFVISTIPTPS
jgi:hypothetical protein